MNVEIEISVHVSLGVANRSVHTRHTRTYRLGYSFAELNKHTLSSDEEWQIHDDDGLCAARAVPPVIMIFPNGDNVTQSLYTHIYTSSMVACIMLSRFCLHWEYADRKGKSPYMNLSMSRVHVHCTTVSFLHFSALMSPSCLSQTGKHLITVTGGQVTLRY